MVKVLIKNDDLDWLELHYPGVIYVSSKNILQGCLWFRMVYFPEKGISVVDPDITIDLTGGIFIEDAYEIEIRFDSSKVVVREVSGRILRTKNKWRFKSLADFHMYSDSSLCLCPEPEERLRFSNGFNLRDFFNNLLIPYLFYQSYLEKFGKEPWKSSTHGDLGILESYDKQLFTERSLSNVVTCYLESLSPSLVKLITANKKSNLNLSCICGSTKKISDCHVSAFNGLKKLYRDYWLAKTGKPQRKDK
jgi:hypothetical protein